MIHLHPARSTHAAKYPGTVVHIHRYIPYMDTYKHRIISHTFTQHDTHTHTPKNIQTQGNITYIDTFKRAHTHIRSHTFTQDDTHTS
jgi:hypothetical protein